MLEVLAVISRIPGGCALFCFCLRGSDWMVCWEVCTGEVSVVLVMSDRWETEGWLGDGGLGGWGGELR